MKIEIVDNNYQKIINGIRFFKLKSNAFIFNIVPFLKEIKIFKDEILYS